MEVSEEFIATIGYVSDMLLHRVPATPVEGETISVPCEGMEGRPTVWTGNTTTYTLGLMLGGALSLERERS